MTERTLIRDLGDQADKPVAIQGWLHKRRLLGGLNFILVRDRSGVVQVLIEKGDEIEKLRGLQVGTVLTVRGTTYADVRAPGGVELHDPELEIIVPVTVEPMIEIDKPLSHKSEHLETLFETRAIGLRNLQEQAIFKVRAAAVRAFRQWCEAHDFTEIQTPKLVAGAAEGGAEVFKLDYFGKKATLAQSPQLYKQMMVGVFERVYEMGPVFRAEQSATTRHVTEVTMLDLEFGFIEGHNDVLEVVQDMVYSVTTELYKNEAERLKVVQAPELVLKPEFPHYTVAKVHELYSEATGTDTTHEKDPTPDEERWICEYAKEHDGCEAVFVTEFPIETLKFYQAVSPDNPQTTLVADLLFRGVEIATCPMREYHYDKLVGQMKDKGVDPESPGFRYYLQAFKYGLPPHGGCGFGVDRYVEKLLGLANIKEAILFPRDTNRLAP